MSTMSQLDTEPLVTSQSEISDVALLDAWRTTKNETAFGMLCQRHTALVLAACRRLGSPDVDEATQAVFIILAQRPETVRDPGHLAGWLVITTRNTVSKQRDAQQRRATIERAAAREIARQRVGVTGGSWSEARSLLEQGLASLSPVRREAVVRYFLEGRSHADVAIELGCTVDAVKTRVCEGLSKLREYFARHAVVMSSAAVISGLTSEMIAAEPAQVARCLAAGLDPTTAPRAAALVSEPARTATYVTFVLGLGLCIAWVIWPRMEHRPAPIGPSTLSVSTPAPPTAASSIKPGLGRSDAADMSVTPRSRQPHHDAFNQVLRQGGPRVASCRTGGELRIPYDMLFTSVSLQQLLDGIATESKMEMVWRHEDNLVVFQPYATSADHLVADMHAVDPTERRHAVWLAGWQRNTRVVGQLFIAAESDPDPGIRQQARHSLRRHAEQSPSGNETLAALGGNVALPYLEAEIAGDDRKRRVSAVKGLALLHGDRALSALLRAVIDRDELVRVSAVYALTHYPGDPAAWAIEQALADREADVRKNAVAALVSVRGERAWPTIRRLYSRSDSTTQSQIVGVLGHASCVNALSMIEPALADQNARVRQRAVMTATSFTQGSVRARMLLEQMLQDPDAEVRRAAAFGVGQADGSRALALVVEAQRDGDVAILTSATTALGFAKSAAALPLLEGLFADHRAEVRNAAIEALISRGGDPEVALLERALDQAAANVGADIMRALQQIGGTRAQALLRKAATHAAVEVEREAIKGLIAVNDPWAPTLIEQMFVDQNASRRTDAARLLGLLGGDRAAQRLSEGLRVEPEQDVRCQIAQELERLGGDQAVDTFIWALASADAEERIQAIRALQNLGGDRAHAALLAHRLMASAHIERSLDADSGCDGSRASCAMAQPRRSGR